MLPTVSGEFRLVADPELVFARTGTPIARMRVVASSRKKDDEGNWVDDKTCWLSAVAFKKVAENVADSFAKGDLVLVNGRLQTEDYEDKDGNKRQSYTVVVDTIGPSLAFNPASSVKAERAAKADDKGDPWTSQTTEDPPF